MTTTSQIEGSTEGGSLPPTWWLKCHAHGGAQIAPNDLSKSQAAPVILIPDASEALTPSGRTHDMCWYTRGVTIRRHNWQLLHLAVHCHKQCRQVCHAVQATDTLLLMSLVCRPLPRQPSSRYHIWVLYENLGGMTDHTNCLTHVCLQLHLV